jgi:Zn-dependent M28 family amino/carboxypeptidase
MIGVLPGKTKPDEIIIFSAHYDHIGLTDGSINYGANDDASGTAGVLMLAKYFALRNDNDRTILFCAFAGEELGLVGSSFFASFVKPEYIKSVINIEMIGKTNAAGKNSFIITGARYSSLERILKANLKNNVVQIHADPGKNNLFERSDNFPFALKGIPAHTIMCSDDNDPCYHQTCDDVKGIDIENMVRVIRAIAIGVQTIVSGDDTPSRISARF